jgi:hypothetical protein
MARKSRAVDFLAREPHFLDHLAPTWKALPEELRGRFYTLEALRPRARELGIEKTFSVEKMAGTRLTVVAAFRDMKLARDNGRRVIISEHGAGQSYQGVESGSYIGAIDRAGCVAALVPGRAQAERHEARHPTIRAYPVGVPKLDPHHASPKPGKKGRVAISFHWDSKVCPETRSALRFYRGELKNLARDFDLVGHSHPRLARQAQAIYRKAGIPFIADFEQLIGEAELYICDNSSTIFEWASLDRPVALLNAPWYRREVEHGMRFWSHADIGLQVDDPKELSKTIRRALQDPIEIAERRRELLRSIYIKTDGQAAKRAAEAIEEIQATWG